jgi:hypothetical protein
MPLPAGPVSGAIVISLLLLFSRLQAQSTATFLTTPVNNNVNTLWITYPSLALSFVKSQGFTDFS